MRAKSAARQRTELWRVVDPCIGQRCASSSWAVVSARWRVRVLRPKAWRPRLRLGCSCNVLTRGKENCRLSIMSLCALFESIVKMMCELTCGCPSCMHVSYVPRLLSYPYLLEGLAPKPRTLPMLADTSHSSSLDAEPEETVPFSTFECLVVVDDCKGQWHRGHGDILTDEVVCFCL